tara:strand:+ start:11290 stop:11775 length:486 start_codon:yes stop_codon:yes gene_type:complete
MTYIYYFIIIFIIILLLCYFLFPSNCIIHQTTLEEFSLDLLTYRQPIVFHDKIVDINNIVKLWFDLNIIHYKIPEIKSNWYRIPYKYCIIKPNTDCDIILSHPTTKIKNNIPDENTSNLISIKLKENQILIIPFKWYIYNDIQKTSQIIGIHDYFTYINLF